MELNDQAGLPVAYSRPIQLKAAHVSKTIVRKSYWVPGSFKHSAEEKSAPANFWVVRNLSRSNLSVSCTGEMDTTSIFSFRPTDGSIMPNLDVYSNPEFFIRKRNKIHVPVRYGDIITLYTSVGDDGRLICPCQQDNSVKLFNPFSSSSSSSSSTRDSQSSSRRSSDNIKFIPEPDRDLVWTSKDVDFRSIISETLPSSSSSFLHANNLDMYRWIVRRPSDFNADGTSSPSITSCDDLKQQDCEAIIQANSPVTTPRHTSRLPLNLDLLRISSPQRRRVSDPICLRLNDADNPPSSPPSATSASVIANPDSTTSPHGLSPLSSSDPSSLPHHLLSLVVKENDVIVLESLAHPGYYIKSIKGINSISFGYDSSADLIVSSPSLSFAMLLNQQTASKRYFDNLNKEIDVWNDDSVSEISDNVDDASHTADDGLDKNRSNNSSNNNNNGKSKLFQRINAVFHLSSAKQQESKQNKRRKSRPASRPRSYSDDGASEGIDDGLSLDSSKIVNQDNDSLANDGSSIATASDCRYKYQNCLSIVCINDVLPPEMIGYIISYFRSEPTDSSNLNKRPINPMRLQLWCEARPMTVRREGNQSLRSCRLVCKSWLRMGNFLVSGLRAGMLFDCSSNSQKQSILKFAIRLPNLAYLCLRNMDGLTDEDMHAARYLRNIRHLNLGGCYNIGDDTIEFVSHCPLVIVNLALSSVTDIGLKMLADRCSRYLATVNLYGVRNVTQAGLWYLLTHCRSLISVNIRGTNISHEAVRALREIASPGCNVLTGALLVTSVFGARPERRALEQNEVDGAGTGGDVG